MPGLLVKFSDYFLMRMGLEIRIPGVMIEVAQLVDGFLPGSHTDTLIAAGK